MLTPLIGFIIGFILLELCFGMYVNRIVSSFFFNIYQVKDNFFYILGLTLISISLMIGMAGYLSYVTAYQLKTVRILLGVIGFLFLTFGFLQSFNIIKNLKKYFNPFSYLISTKLILSVLAITILFSIFLISFFDSNYGGDAFMYHLPFAARIWNIITPEEYSFEYYTEHRFLGFPLFANWLQGLFWKLFQKPEATNLVSYLSLLTIISYLKLYLKIPFYMASLSLLAIPMVHMHAARSYIDLPGNIAVSILILTTYCLYINKNSLKSKNLLIIFISATIAANTKFQLIPVVFIVLCFVLFKIKVIFLENKKNFPKLFRSVTLCLLASLIVFFTPIKNTVIYSNPFYPVEIKVAEFVLNNKETPPDFMHENIRKLSPYLRWGRSILEIDVFDDRRPWPWTLGMDFISWDEEKFGLGGYFGSYVIFNFLLFIYLCWKNYSLEAKVASSVMALMTVITPLFPQSYELRYYMYWMIVFVSLNSFLTCQLVQKSSQKVINPKNNTLIATFFVMTFIIKTKFFFTIPEFASFNKQIMREDIVDQNILRSINNGDNVCIVNKAPHTFLYSSHFYSPNKYSVKAEFNIDLNEEECKGRKILKN